MESCPWSSILYFSNVKAHVALVLVTLIVSSLMMKITVFLRTLHVSEKHPTHQHRTVCGPDGWKHEAMQKRLSWKMQGAWKCQCLIKSDNKAFERIRGWHFLILVEILVPDKLESK